MRVWPLLLAACLAVACGGEGSDGDDGGDGGDGAAAGSGGAGGGGGATALSLTFIDDFNIATGTLLDGVQLGGLSGLWVDPADGHAWAICDDQQQFGPVRFYELDISVDAMTLAVTPTSHTVFDTASTPPAEMDAEGIARNAAGELYISSEGDTTPLVAPQIIRVDGSGTLIEELNVDSKHIPDFEGTKGVRRNQGFEALTLSPDGTTLFTATENALVQDGPDPSFSEGSRCRILRYDLAGGSPVAEYVYRTDPIPRPAQGVLGNANIGVPELLAVSNTDLLVLERAAVEVDGIYTNTIRIYEVSIGGALDIAGEPSMPVSTPPLSKRLVLDLDTILPLLDPAYPRLDNFEAMSFGPPLPDGRDTLVLLSDNNFGSDQRTAFFAFAID